MSPRFPRLPKSINSKRRTSEANEQRVPSGTHAPSTQPTPDASFASNENPTIDTNATPEQHAQDTSTLLPSPEVTISSKIAPNLSELLASFEEDALSLGLKPPKRRTAPRAVSESNKPKSPKKSPKSGKLKNRSKSFADENRPPTSLGKENWPTFGYGENAPLSDYNDPFKRLINTNVKPTGTDPVLSWSPVVKAPETPKVPIPPLSIKKLPKTPRNEAEKSATSPFYAPSPRTFGQPTPLQNTPSGTPAFPFPPFQSTPKTSTPKPDPPPGPSPSPSLHRIRLITTSSTMGSTTFGKQSRGQNVRPKASSIFHKSSKTDLKAQRQRTSSRPRKSAPSQIPRRRKSAEWSSQAASNGVVADPSQTQEFGWPAEVSREILRLSLCGEAKAHAGQDARRTSTVAKPETIELRTTAGSKEEKESLPEAKPRPRSISAPNGRRRKTRPAAHVPPAAEAGLMKDDEGQRILSPSQPFSFVPPPSLSTLAPSAVPKGAADRPGQDFATSHSDAPKSNRATIANENFTTDSNLPSLADNVLGTTNTHAEKPKSTLAEPMIEHKRTKGEDQIKWESQRIQEFMDPDTSGSTGDGVGDDHGDLLLPSEQMKPSHSTSTYETAGSSSYMHAPSLSQASNSPQDSPTVAKDSLPASEVPSEPQTPITPVLVSDKSRGKRKADDTEDGRVGGTKEVKTKKTTFAPDGKRPHLNSTLSQAPSSFQSLSSHKSRKRVRLSSPINIPDVSHADSSHLPTTGSVSSLSSRSAAASAQHPRSGSRMSAARPASRASRAISSGESGGRDTSLRPMSYASTRGKRASRASLAVSHTSIPISAIITPRAPSINRLSTFHMRDPRKPPPQRLVGWSLRRPTEDEDGSPIHAWLFWLGLIFPPCWWVASLWRIPQTRMVGADPEKAAVFVDDPQVEKEARTWRLRCRVASVAFFFTYAPVIILLAIFVPRS